MLKHNNLGAYCSGDPEQLATIAAEDIVKIIGKGAFPNKF